MKLLRQNFLVEHSACLARNNLRNKEYWLLIGSVPVLLLCNIPPKFNDLQQLMYYSHRFCELGIWKRYIKDGLSFLHSVWGLS